MSSGAKGRFVKGQHWRPRQPFWDREWLYTEYVVKGRSEADIAAQFSVTPNAIWFWMRKHGIVGRTTSEVRSRKHWGAEGERNPMFGKRGHKNPNWRGGTTPLRQGFYSNPAWRRVSRQVRERDRACQLCNGSERLQIHHIIPFWYAPLLVFTLWNLIRLCRRCHKKIEGKELRWAKRLFALVVGKEANQYEGADPRRACA